MIVERFGSRSQLAFDYEGTMCDEDYELIFVCLFVWANGAYLLTGRAGTEGVKERGGVEMR